MYRRILVPLDGSKLAETALPHAELIASATGASVELIRVTVLRFVHAPSGDGYVVQEQADRSEAEQYLQEWRRKLSARGLTATYQVRGGNVAEEIVRHATETGTDLIVMTSHGLTGIRSYAYGSVAYRVLGSAPCSVLVVRDSGKQRGK